MNAQRSIRLSLRLETLLNEQSIRAIFAPASGKMGRWRLTVRKLRNIVAYANERPTC